MDDRINAEASPRKPVKGGMHDEQVLERSLILAFVAAAGTSMLCLPGSDLHQFWTACAWKLQFALTQVQ
jgi:hypothetical protein